MECRLRLVTAPFIQCWVHHVQSASSHGFQRPRPKLPRYMEKTIAEMVHGIVDVMHRDLPKACRERLMLHQWPRSVRSAGWAAGATPGLSIVQPHLRRHILLGLRAGPWGCFQGRLVTEWPWLIRHVEYHPGCYWSFSMTGMASWLLSTHVPVCIRPADGSSTVSPTLLGGSIKPTLPRSTQENGHGHPTFPEKDTVQLSWDCMSLVHSCTAYLYRLWL